MPYAAISELPDAVKQLPEKRKRQWIAVWNSSYERCLEKKGDSKKCETAAFRQAWSVVGKREKMTASEIEKHIQNCIFKSSGNESRISQEEYMAVEKATTDSGLHLAIPITKVDHERRMVYGTMVTEDLDSQFDITDYDAAVKALASWPGNIREMHDPKKAVGSAVEIMPNSETRKIDIGAYISKGAEDTWLKVQDGTLKGFSIAVPTGKFKRTPTMAKVKKSSGEEEEVKANKLFVDTFSEVSLVDNPANPAAQIYLVKAADDGGLTATSILGDSTIEKQMTPGEAKAVAVGLAPPPTSDIPVEDLPAEKAKAEKPEEEVKPEEEKKEFPFAKPEDKPAAEEEETEDEEDEEEEEEESEPAKATGVEEKKIEIPVASDTENMLKSLPVDAPVEEDVSKIGARNNKDDLNRIQGIHDHTLELGAVCKQKENPMNLPAFPEKAVETAIDSILKSESFANAITKAVEEKLKDAIGDVVKSVLGGIIKSDTINKMVQSEVQVVADGITKAADELKAEALTIAKEAAAEVAKSESMTVVSAVTEEIKAELTTEVQKVSEITSKHEETIGKIDAAVTGVTKAQEDFAKSTDERLKTMEKAPALPVVRAVVDPRQTDVAKGTEVDSQIAVLEELQRTTDSPLLKQQLGQEIALRLLRKRR
jgi:cation transport regulator ChaB